MTAFYVLARPMTPGKHEPWRCVGRFEDYAAADALSAYWSAKPGHESSIVAASALLAAEIERFDVALKLRAARRRALA